uniref:FYVE-type domain-containing protein n=1 Tax=Phytophthora ramorum TaxID=164328 RepID=H3GWI8_PHYRM
MASALHLLSRDERFQCDRRSEELLGETLAAFAGFDSARLAPNEWKFLARRDQMTVHRAVSSTRLGVDSHKRRVIANGFLDASLADVLGGLYVEDDRELLTTQALLNPSGSTAVDAAVLMIAERRQPRAAPFRFAGVKWYSWKKNVDVLSPNLSLGEGQECDLLTYERMGVALAEDGDKQGTQELAYHVLLSLNKPEWPLHVGRGPGLRRADLALCFLFRKVCDDLVECFTLVDYDCRTSASSRRAADTEMADRVLMVTRLPDCARAKILSGFARKAKGRPVLTSKSCLRCGSRKKVLDPLRVCCICKKSVCQKCYEKKAVFSLNSRTHEPETDAFCNKCLARIRILTAKKKVQHNTSASVCSSSTGGSSKDRDRESHSGGSSGSGGKSSSKSSFKFWKKSRKELSPRAERERRRHSSPAPITSRGEPHTPNYEGLFQNYDVFGRASDNPRRPQFNQEESELGDEQEPEKEQENVEPQREKRWRQTTFLANPEAAAAEAAATNRLSMVRQRIGPAPNSEAEGNTIAEVYPVAKTVLETEDIYAEDSDDSPHSEAEKAHLLYLERRQRLDELEDRPDSRRREVLTTPLPVQKAKKELCVRGTFPASNADQMKSYRNVGGTVTDGRQLLSRAAPPEHAERKPAVPEARNTKSTRAARRNRQRDNEDTFRMDLYGRF